MTNQQLSEADERVEDRTFTVRCISCGAMMRDDKTEDSFGQCWKCYYRIVNQYLRSQRHNSNCLVASER